MAKKIWKYPIDTMENDLTIEMPEDSELLYFDVQKEIPTLWVLVNTEKKFEKRYFRVLGTGDSIEDDNLDYIGSIQLVEGDFIFHLFESLNNRK